MNMAFCIECGISLPEGARFCPSCGKAVAQTEATPVVEEVSVVEEASVIEDAPVAEEIAVIEEAPVLAEPASEDVAEENVYAAEYTQTNAENAVAESACEENVYEEEVVQTPAEAPGAIYDATQSDTYIPSSTKEEQQACLDNIYARLKNERLCWKIFGFVWIGYSALFTILGFVAPVLFLYIVLMWLPMAIICFKMIGKVDYYINSLYTDCSHTVTRCSSIGMIVFGALFNTVAMIFIIINFVNVKTNEKILKDIKHNQDIYNNRI